MTPAPDETADVICGEPEDDGLGLIVVAAETGDPLPDEVFDAETETGQLDDLDPDRDLAVLEAADALEPDGEEPDPADLTVPRRAARAATATLSTAQARTILVRLGWRVRNASEYTQAVKLFQRAWALGPALRVDGKVGPLTSAALRVSEANRVARRGTASRYFSFHEFACKCGGRYSACARVWVFRHHLLRMDQYRARIGRPVVVVSGCRCSQHNKAVGGASNSQHMHGTATDITYAATDTTVRRWGLFAGLGRSASTHKVRHVDSRDIGGHNTTRGTTARPTVWNYSS